MSPTGQCREVCHCSTRPVLTPDVFPTDSPDFVPRDVLVSNVQYTPIRRENLQRKFPVNPPPVLPDLLVRYAFPPIPRSSTLTPPPLTLPDDLPNIDIHRGPRR